MSDGTPTPINAANEITQNYRVGASNGASRTWQIAAFFLGMIITGGTILSVAGKAFYVTRGEYTQKVQDDNNIQTTLKLTLENLRTSMTSQEVAFRDMTATVNRLQVDMASVGLHVRPVKSQP